MNDSFMFSGFEVMTYSGAATDDSKLGSECEDDEGDSVPIMHFCLFLFG